MKPSRKKLNKSLFLLLIVIVLLTLSSCQQKEEQKANQQNPNDEKVKFKVEVALKDFQKESKELLMEIENRDYIKSEEQITKLNKIWNDFYPSAFKSGLKLEMVNEFIASLNNVSDKVMKFANEQKRLDIKNKVEKSKMQITQFLNSLEIQPPSAQQSGSKQGEQNSKSSSSPTGSSKKNSQSGSSQNNQQSSSSNTTTEISYDTMLTSFKLPNEIIKETYPEVSFSKDDAQNLLAAVQLYRHFSVFFSINDKPQQSELFLMKYYFEDIKANAMLEDWEKVSKDLTNMKLTWSNLQSLLMKDQEDSALQITQNIYETGDLIAKKDILLLKMKCKLAISNIDKLLENSK